MSNESRKFHVPDPLANLYDFANSLDLRRFVHHGVQHHQADAFADLSSFQRWMSGHALTARGYVPSKKAFDDALRLRVAIRGYLRCNPDERPRQEGVVEALNKALGPFPLRVAAIAKDGFELLAARGDAEAGLSTIVAELYNGAANGTLNRLKMCAADECLRVFFDRSKPGTRRWCQSTLCGNREKTRSYRERHKGEQRIKN